MKKILIILAILIIAGAGWWFFKGKGTNQDVVLERPWVEVVSASLSEVDNSGAGVKELQTGDEVADGAILKTDSYGEAIIHFPDGSEARMEANTTVTISNASYSQNDGSLVVRLSLNAGRIWSKVISLSTPESEWKVETANAVATVRGTAFGSEYLNGDSNFVGSENIVAIKAKNPDTGEEIEGTETELTPEDIIELPKKDIQRIIAAKSALAKKKIDEESREDFREWINEQREKDEQIEERLEELRNNGLSDEEVKEELREEIKQNFIQEILERREILEGDESGNSEEPLGDETFFSRIMITQLREQIVSALIEHGEKDAALKVKSLSDAEISALLKRFFSGDLTEILSSEAKFTETLESLIKEYGTTREGLPVNQTQPAPSSSGGVAPAKITGIKVTSEANLASPVTEGREVRLKALAVLSDGTTLDVTAKAKWQVVGPVGSIISAGVFSPKLGADVAELGESYGSVTAVFEAEAGAVYLGQTPIFKVIPQTPVSAEEVG